MSDMFLISAIYSIAALSAIGYGLYNIARFAGWVSRRTHKHQDNHEADSANPDGIEEEASDSETADTPSPVDPFTILGVRKDAALKEIKQAYRRLAVVYHPDSSRNPETGRIFQMIHDAYEKALQARKEAPVEESQAGDKARGHNSFCWECGKPLQGREQNPCEACKTRIEQEKPIHLNNPSIRQQAEDFADFVAKRVEDIPSIFSKTTNTNYACPRCHRKLTYETEAGGNGLLRCGECNLQWHLDGPAPTMPW